MIPLPSTLRRKQRSECCVYGADGLLQQQSDLTIKAAGLAVGFEDPYHFSRVFKQIHGVAPRDFKRGGAR